MTESKTRRAAVIDAMVRQIDNSGLFENVTYDRLFDLSRGDRSRHAWVYDTVGTYAPKSTRTNAATVSATVIVTYPHADGECRTTGNVELGRIYRSVLSDWTFGGEAFLTRPVEEDIWEYPEVDNVGLASMKFEIEYEVGIQDPTVR